MIEELEADTTVKTGFGGTSYAGSSAPHGGVAVSICTCGCSQNVDEGVNGILPLLPKQLSGFFRSEEC